MTKTNKENTETEQTYNKRDVLVVEIDSFVDNYVVPNLMGTDPVIVRSTTKKKVEILAEQLDDLMKDVEEELHEWESALKWEDRQLEAFKRNVAIEEGKQVENLTPDECLHAERLLYMEQKNAPRKFFEDMGRPRKALRSVKVIENKGPQSGDFQSQNEKRQQLDDLMKEALIKLLEEKKEASKK